MVVFYVAHTLPFNPPGASPILTPSQAWAGLMCKVRRPKDFIAVVEECQVVPEGDGVFSFVTKYKPGSPHGSQSSGAVRVYPTSRVEYELDDGSRSTQLISYGSSGDSELFLTFAFMWNHPDLAPGGEEFVDLEKKYRLAAKVAVESTVSRVRELAIVGQLDEEAQ